MHNRDAMKLSHECAPPPVPTGLIIKKRPRIKLSSIWSLNRRREITVWIHYQVRPAQPAQIPAQILDLQRVEEVEP